MKPISPFRIFLLTKFSKPASDRVLYQEIRRLKAQAIVEIGIGNAARTETMLRVAQKFCVTDTVRYTGIDLFEGREKIQDHLTLKDMHKRIQALGVKAQLVPGSPSMAVPRIANSNLRTDLIIISGGTTEADLEECWAYFPRMLHAQSVVMFQPALNEKFLMYSRLEIEKRANLQRKITRAQAA
jgi:hypothetical protein